MVRFDSPPVSTIDIYTTPQCGFCKQIKALLTEKSMVYTEHDVTSSDELLKEMQEITRGALSVPVVVVNKGTDTQKYAIGFDEAKVLLHLSKEQDGAGDEKGETANLTCPTCGHVQGAPIPTTSCVPFYICDGCKETIQAEGEDCCVFCSYADKPCPISTKKDRGGSSCKGGVCGLPS